MTQFPAFNQGCRRSITALLVLSRATAGRESPAGNLTTRLQELIPMALVKQLNAATEISGATLAAPHRRVQEKPWEQQEKGPSILQSNMI